ncbi:hypothetical protein AgCh_030417 [Apium graveolens]
MDQLKITYTVNTSRMTSRVPIHLHHHGKFTPKAFNGECGYIGGRIDIINDVDTDIFCTRDLEDYAVTSNYSKNDFHYFKRNGHNFKDGIRKEFEESEECIVEGVEDEDDWDFDDEDSEDSEYELVGECEDNGDDEDFDEEDYEKEGEFDFGKDWDSDDMREEDEPEIPKKVSRENNRSMERNDDNNDHLLCSEDDRMTSRVPIHLHHHGKFTPKAFNGECGYIGGRIDIINDVDTDIFCTRDLEDYAVTSNYSKNDFHYFKRNGHNFKDGIRKEFEESEECIVEGVEDEDDWDFDDEDSEDSEYELVGECEDNGDDEDFDEEGYEKEGEFDFGKDWDSDDMREEGEPEIPKKVSRENNRSMERNDDNNDHLLCSEDDRMTSRVPIHLHHHGKFTPKAFNGECGYIGGRIDIINDVDTDIFCTRDLEDYAVTSNYSKNDFHYFKRNGHNFKDGIRKEFEESEECIVEGVEDEDDWDFDDEDSEDSEYELVGECEDNGDDEDFDEEGYEKEGEFDFGKDWDSDDMREEGEPEIPKKVSRENNRSMERNDDNNDHLLCSEDDRMTSRVPIHLHHHGKFTPKAFNGECGYIGGRIDIINDVDTDIFCTRDLEDYAVTSNYSKNDFHYFKRNGHNFKDGIRKEFEESEECIVEGVEDEDDWDFDDEDSEDSEYELVGECEDNGDDEDFDEEDYEKEGEFDFGKDWDSDDMREEGEPEIPKKVSRENNRSMERNDDNNDHLLCSEDEFDSNKLRSLPSSSEDENVKKGYVGVSPGNRKRKKLPVHNPHKLENVKFSAGMRFESMEEFRKAVKDYE